MSLLSKLPESTATTELWRRLGDSALDEKSTAAFLSEWHVADEDTPAACRQQIAVAAWAAASAGDAAEARFLRRLLRGRGLGGGAKSTSGGLLHQKAGWVTSLPA